VAFQSRNGDFWWQYLPILINHHIIIKAKALLYLSTISDVPCDTTLENYRVTIELAIDEIDLHHLSFVYSELY
jgi:hypothetical protein